MNRIVDIIEDTDKVKGFSVGGDDCIVKPFSFVELEARVCVHLRREALLPIYHVLAFSLLSVEQMSNGMLYAIWAIPAAFIFLGIGTFFSRRMFAKHQVI